MKRSVILSLAAASFMPACALEFKLERDMPYYPEGVLAQEGDYAREMCRIEVRYPVGVTNFATVLHFHGGGLVRGTKHGAPWPEEARNKDPVAFAWAGYRLLTNATPEQCIADAAAAVAWTVKNIARYGGDPKKVFVTGTSGGGYLSAMVGLDAKWLAPHGLSPLDLGGVAPLTGQMTKHFNVRKVGFKDDEPTYLPKIDAWAPLAYASTNKTPPCCFMTGGRDTEIPGRVEENDLLAASLRANGAKNCEFHETEGNHGGGVYPSSYFLRDFVMKTCNAGGVARFADGERVAFFGDSITHGGSYHSVLQLFWSLRHPGSDVRLLNCGIGGDTASGGLVRADVDLLPMRPNRVFVMFGMNDVGIGNYGAKEPTEQAKAARAKSLAIYAGSQRKVVDLLMRKRIKTVLITPTPYDEYTAAVPAVNAVGANELGLSSAAETVRALAAEKNLGLVEFHRPLTEIFRANTEKPFCRDRVHPNANGHMIMAALLLDAMHVKPLVARVSLDARTGKAHLAADRSHVDANGKRLPDMFHAAATHIAVRADGVAFTYAPRALPFPVTPAYTNAEAFYPLTKRLNQELFIIENLAPGQYELAFDGVAAGIFSAEAFGKGVNVACLDTPNQRRAQETATIVDRLREKCAAWRGVVNMEKRILRQQKIDPEDRAAADAYFDKWVAEMTAQKKPWADHYRRQVKRYRELRNAKPALLAEIDDLYERVNAVRPAVSRVTLRRVPE